MDTFHTPVMPSEVIKFLNIRTGFWYVDCNLGTGGHSSEILKRGGRVLGLDVDDDAISQVSERFRDKVVRGDLVVAKSNFNKVDGIVKKSGIGPVAGVLFDLGVSSYQLESPERGFSFNKPGMLDMRMDKELKITAADLVNGLYEKELAEVLWKFGEEKYAKKIAKKIVLERKKGKITTTDELANIIVSVIPKSFHDRIHPATRTFQALRIVINDELNNLKDALPKAFGILGSRGRMVVLSFHSLEDRIVKHFFQDISRSKQAVLLTKKPVVPSELEIEKNPRARSGKLRALVKT